MINRVDNMTEQDKIPEAFLKGFKDGIADIIALDKTVREYTGRKRINITKSDGLYKDDHVIVLRKSDYDRLIADYERLLQMESDQENQEVTADTISEKFLEPVKDGFNDIIDGLKQDIKDKDTEINRLKAVYQDYDKQVYSLGLLDILRHENKKMSDDFNSKVWITTDDQLVTDTEVRKLDPTGDDRSGDV